MHPPATHLEPAPPPVRAFGLTVRDEIPGVRELAPRGEVDLDTAARLEEAIAAATAERRAILLDLCACDFVDSTAIAVILRGREALRDAGLDLVACSPAGQVRRVMGLVGLFEHRVVLDRRDDAVAALAPG